MAFRSFLKRQNRISVKILFAFLCLLFFFAVAEIVVSNRRMSRSIDSRTIKLLRNHTRLLNELIREQEEKVTFYAQFMADVTKVSDQLSDTSAGRSVLVYMLESLKKDRIRVRLYRGLDHKEEKNGLIRKGLLGLRTTALLADETDAGGLTIAAVAPIERAGSIGEVIVADFPLDRQFLEGVKRKTGADLTLIHRGRLFSSTFESDFPNQSLLDILDGEAEKEILERGRTVIRDMPDQRNPQKVAFVPLSINFRNQGVYAISESLRRVMLNKRSIVIQNILITTIILISAAVPYFLIVRRITRPIKRLSSASRKIAAGDLNIAIDVATADEIGELGESFNRMIHELRESREKVKSHMDQLSRLYGEVSEERNISKSILNNLTNGVILFDPNNRIVLMNPTAEAWLGIKEEQVRGMQVIGDPPDPSFESLYQLGGLRPHEEMIRCWKYFECDRKECPAFDNKDLRCWFVKRTHCGNSIAKTHDEKMSACRECDVYSRYRSVVGKGEEVRIEELELGAPQRRIVKVSLCPIFDEHEKFLGLIQVLNDMTAERELDRMKTEFVSLVSHELRTPLSSIKAYAEILLKKPDRDLEQRLEFLNIINEETDRLTRLINDILNVTRIEERRIDLEKEPVSISQTIEKVVSTHRSSAQRKDIRIEIDVLPDISPIWGDQDSLMQVLGNLLNNAVKYTPRGGAIRMSAKYAGDTRASNMAEVSVKDSGIGIPAEYLERVFDKFYRIERPAARTETGSGLGLYFCKYIVERHGGQIRVESDDRKGSTFTFSLPLATTDAMSRERSERLLVDGALHYPRELRHNMPILVVDDEEKIRKFMRYYLQEEGFPVYEAENGARALELARSLKPGVVFLDTVMPDLDGYEVLEALKMDKETRDIPIIVLSGAENSQVAMELGASDYLVKPVERKTLIRALGQILKSSANKHHGHVAP